MLIEVFDARLGADMLMPLDHIAIEAWKWRKYEEMASNLEGMGSNLEKI